MHTAADGAGEQLGYPGALLDEFFGGVVGNHQLMQADSAFVAGLVAFVAAYGTVKLQASVHAVAFGPVVEQLLRFAARVVLPGGAVFQVLGVFVDEVFELLRGG